MYQPQSGPYRIRVAQLGWRQRITSQPLSQASTLLKRLLALLAAGTLILILLSTVILHSLMVRTKTEMARLEEAHTQLAMENIRLKAVRARFFSPDHLREVAAARLRLHPPAQGQVIHF